MCINALANHQTETLRYQDSLRRFATALASLSYMEQNLLYLSYYQEIPLKQLAALYGLSPKTINRRLQRIYRKLDKPIDYTDS